MKEANFWSRCVLLAGVVFAVGPIALAENKAADTTKKSATQSEQAAAEKSLLARAAKYDKAGVAPSEFCQCINVDLDATMRIEQALAKPLSRAGLDFADTPLKAVVDQLATDTDLVIMLDKPALEEAGVGTDAPVTTSIHNVSLRSALRLLLKQLGLTYIIQDEVLLITTNEGAEQNLRTCVYDVRSITNDQEKPTDVLIKTIQSCVARDSWKANGRGEAEISAVKPGILVITQTYAVHEAIHDLLATIKRMTQNGRADNKTSSAAEARSRTSESAATFATKPASGVAPANGRSPSVADDPFR
jgi:hypothetical protein